MDHLLLSVLHWYFLPDHFNKLNHFSSDRSQIQNLFTFDKISRWQWEQSIAKSSTNKKKIYVFKDWQLFPSGGGKQKPTVYFAQKENPACLPQFLMSQGNFEAHDGIELDLDFRLVRKNKMYFIRIQNTSRIYEWWYQHAVNYADVPTFRIIQKNQPILGKSIEYCSERKKKKEKRRERKKGKEERGFSSFPHKLTSRTFK